MCTFPLTNIDANYQVDLGSSVNAVSIVEGVTREDFFEYSLRSNQLLWEDIPDSVCTPNHTGLADKEPFFDAYTHFANKYGFCQDSEFVTPKELGLMFRIGVVILIMSAINVVLSCSTLATNGVTDGMLEWLFWLLHCF